MADQKSAAKVSRGEIVAEGTPEKVAKTKGSFTGHYLAPLLERAPAPEPEMAE